MNNVFIMKKRILYALGAALLVFGVVVLIHVDRGAITNMYNLLLLLVVGIGVSSLVMIWAIYPLVSTSKKGLLVLFFGGICPVAVGMAGLILWTVMKKVMQSTPVVQLP